MPSDKNDRSNKSRLLAATVIALMASACAGGENLSAQDTEDDPQGRGVLTGGAGEFVIYGK